MPNSSLTVKKKKVVTGTLGYRTTADPLLLKGLFSAQLLAEDKKKNGRNHNTNSSVGSMMERDSHIKHFHSRV